MVAHDFASRQVAIVVATSVPVNRQLVLALPTGGPGRRAVTLALGSYLTLFQLEWRDGLIWVTARNRCRGRHSVRHHCGHHSLER